MALVRDLAVVLDPRRRCPEYEAILAIEVGIEHKDERIGFVERGVSERLAENERSWVAVEEPRAYVERLPVVGDSNLSALRDRSSLGRLSLDEAREDLTLCPYVVVEPAIDDRCTGNRGRARGRRLLSLDVHADDEGVA